MGNPVQVQGLRYAPVGAEQTSTGRLAPCYPHDSIEKCIARIYGDSRGTSAPEGRLYALCKERQQIGTFKRLTHNKSRSFLRFDISWAWKHIEN